MEVSKFDGSDQGLSIGQYLQQFESQPITQREKKARTLLNLRPPASKWAESVYLEELTQWKDVKYNLVKEYGAKMTVIEKVKLRKELLQNKFESCQDFFNRCKKTQFLICDDAMEQVLERDILINFLFGLREEFYEALIKIDNLKTLESFFCEAVKIECLTSFEKEEMQDPSDFVEAKFEDDQNDYILHDLNEKNVRTRKAKPQNDNSDHNNTSVANMYEDDCIADNTFPGEFEIKNEDFEANESGIMEHSLETKDEEMFDNDSIFGGGEDEVDVKDDTEQFSDEISEDENRKNPRRSGRARKCTVNKESIESLGADVENDRDSDFDPIDYEDDSPGPAQTEKKNDKDSDFDPAEYEDDPKPTYPCELCGLVYKKKDKLKRHVEQQQHHQVPKFKCPHCALPFITTKILRYHAREIHKDLGLQCPVCQYFFTSKKMIELHKHKHHPTLDEEKKHVCALCSNSFMYKQTVLKHIRVDHFNEEPVECRKCFKKFPTKEALSNHMPIHNTELKYECKDCDAKYFTSSKLYAHRKQAHSTHPGYVCEICAKSFKHKHGLTAHKVKQHESEENGQVFVCDQCGKTHNNEFSAKAHKQRHSQSEIPVECHVCSKVCKGKASLRAHMKSHQVKKRTHKCDFCPKAFNSHYIKIVHEKRMHLNIRDLKCDQCDFATSSKQHLNTHIKALHSGIMHACTFPGCTKAYNERGNLYAHRKRVHGIARPNELKPEPIILPSQE